MIKSNKGKVEIEGTRAELLADITRLVDSFIDNERICAGKDRKERAEWFKKEIVDLALDEGGRREEARQAAEKIAKLIGRETVDVLKGILKAISDADGDDDDEDDDE